MKRRTQGRCLLGAILLLVSLVAGFSLAQAGFKRSYGGREWDSGSSVQQTPDGGYIITGYTESFGAGGRDVYLIKTDPLGNTLWDRTYGGGSDDVGLSVQQTVDGGYIITGYTESFGAGGSDVYLLKTNSLGETLWDKAYGGGSSDGGHAVQQTEDGGYVVAGYTESFGAGQRDVYLTKTDSLGNVVWKKTYGGSSDDCGNSIQQTQDGGYIIAGYTESIGAGARDVYLIKMDSTGGVLWERAYGGSSDDMGLSAQVTLDGGYVIAGRTESFGVGGGDTYWMKTDSFGNVVWEKTYGGVSDDCGSSIQQTRDGGYIIAGYTGSFGAGGHDVYLIRTDSLGNVVWDRTYGSSSNDVGLSVEQTADHGFIIAGWTESFGVGGSDVYLVKTDENEFVAAEDRVGAAFGGEDDLLPYAKEGDTLEPQSFPRFGFQFGLSFYNPDLSGLEPAFTATEKWYRDEGYFVGGHSGSFQVYPFLFWGCLRVRFTNSIGAILETGNAYSSDVEFKAVSVSLLYHFNPLGESNLRPFLGLGVGKYYFRAKREYEESLGFYLAEISSEGSCTGIPVTAGLELDLPKAVDLNFHATYLHTSKMEATVKHNTKATVNLRSFLFGIRLIIEL